MQIFYCSILFTFLLVHDPIFFDRWLAGGGDDAFNTLLDFGEWSFCYFPQRSLMKNPLVLSTRAFCICWSIRLKALMLGWRWTMLILTTASRFDLVVRSHRSKRLFENNICTYQRLVDLLLLVTAEVLLFQCCFLLGVSIPLLAHLVELIQIHPLASGLLVLVDGIHWSSSHSCWNHPGCCSHPPIDSIEDVHESCWDPSLVLKECWCCTLECIPAASMLSLLKNVGKFHCLSSEGPVE